MKTSDTAVNMSDDTNYCESSISLEGDRGKDRVRLCRLSMSFQEGSHQKLFFDLKDKNYKKVKMKGGLGWMNDPARFLMGTIFLVRIRRNKYTRPLFTPPDR